MQNLATAEAEPESQRSSLQRIRQDTQLRVMLSKMRTARYQMDLIRSQNSHTLAHAIKLPGEAPAADTVHQSNCWIHYECVCNYAFGVVTVPLDKTRKGLLNH